MKKQAKKLMLAKETVGHLDRLAQIGQVVGGIFEDQSDGSRTMCDVCDAVKTRASC